jgi:hypothetical protein
MTAPINDSAKDRSRIGKVLRLDQFAHQAFADKIHGMEPCPFAPLGVTVCVGDPFVRHLDPQRLDVLHKRMLGKAGVHQTNFTRLALLGRDDFERPPEQARRQISRGRKGKPWGT